MTRPAIRVGPIEAAIARETTHVAIEVTVGDFVLFIQATPKGRRVFLSIDDGSVDVQIARRHKDGHWA